MLLSCTFATGCLNQAIAADQFGNTILFDSWWSYDYGKSGCAPAFAHGDRGRLCRGPDFEVNLKSDLIDFVDTLATQITVNANCKGVTFYGWPSSTPSAGRSEVYFKSHWEFSIDYNWGDSAQPWKLWYFPHAPGPQFPTSVLRGEGTPAKIAADICAIVLRQGGTLAR
jgi:hypothetical protein